MRAVPVLLGALVATALAGGGLVLATRSDPPPPPTLALPAAAPVTPALEPVGAAGGTAPSAAGVAARLAAAVASPALGTSPAARVVDVGTGEVLLEIGSDRSVVPASTAKIVTAVAALSTLDPDDRLTTRVVRGAEAGSLVLVGAGDPTLTTTAVPGEYPVRGSLAELADEVVAAGISEVTALTVDASLYSGPVLGPGWSPGYVTSGDVAPVTALMVDGGRPDPTRNARSDTPDLLAGERLRTLLAARGVSVPASVVRGVAPEGGEAVADTRSDTVSVLVELMLATSDNDLAEALGRQVALASGRSVDFAGVGQALGAALAPYDVPAGSVALVDASGLSRDDRLTPAALTRLLILAAGERPALRPVLSGLPVAGFTGTLADRFRTGGNADAAGEVRAKTGTLSGVSALAGTVLTADGRLLAFALAADGVPATGTATLEARAALDAVATALAGCGCP